MIGCVSKCDTCSRIVLVVSCFGNKKLFEKKTILVRIFLSVVFFYFPLPFVVVVAVVVWCMYSVSFRLFECVCWNRVDYICCTWYVRVCAVDQNSWVSGRGVGFFGLVVRAK